MFQQRNLITAMLFVFNFVATASAALNAVVDGVPHHAPRHEPPFPPSSPVSFPPPAPPTQPPSPVPPSPVPSPPVPPVSPTPNVPPSPPPPPPPAPPSLPAPPNSPPAWFNPPITPAPAVPPNVQPRQPPAAPPTPPALPPPPAPPLAPGQKWCATGAELAAAINTIGGTPVHLELVVPMGVTLTLRQKLVIKGGSNVTIIASKDANYATQPALAAADEDWSGIPDGGTTMAHALHTYCPSFGCVHPYNNLHVTAPVPSGIDPATGGNTMPQTFQNLHNYYQPHDPKQVRGGVPVGPHGSDVRVRSARTMIYSEENTLTFPYVSTFGADQLLPEWFLTEGNIPGYPSDWKTQGYPPVPFAAVQHQRAPKGTAPAQVTAVPWEQFGTAWTFTAPGWTALAPTIWVMDPVQTAIAGTPVDAYNNPMRPECTLNYLMALEGVLAKWGTAAYLGQQAAADPTTYGAAYAAAANDAATFQANREIDGDLFGATLSAKGDFGCGVSLWGTDTQSFSVAKGGKLILKGIQLTTNGAVSSPMLPGMHYPWVGQASEAPWASFPGSGGPNEMVGYYAAGGALEVIDGGVAELQECTFIKCSATLQGGAFAVHSAGNLKMTMCELYDNHVSLHPGSGGGTGCIYNAGTVCTLIQTSITHSTATYAGGLVLGNLLAQQTETRPPPYQTGYTAGQYGYLELFECLLEDCQAHNIGGGVFAIASGVDCRLTVFKGCEAHGTSQTSGAGGMAMNSGAQCTVLFSQFIGCRATGSMCGGLGTTDLTCAAVCIGVKFTDCHAYRWGGGFFHVGKSTMTDIMVDDCHAVIGGGATYLALGELDNTLTNARISRCTSITTEGEGGGVAFTRGAGATFTDVTIHDCTAEAGGGGLSVANECVCTAYRCHFYNCYSATYGGAILSLSGSSFYLQAGTVTNCTAPKGGGVSAKAGAVIFDACTLTACHTIEDGCGDNSGGFAVVYDKGHLDIKHNCTLTNCYAQTYGGAVYLLGGLFTMSDSVSTDHIAQAGGHFSVNGGSMVMDRCEVKRGSGMMDGTQSYISPCSGGNGGGGFAAYGEFSSLIVRDSAISECAAEAGGAVRMASFAYALFERCTFFSNSACSSGGTARMQDKATLRLKDSIVSDSNAGTFGGAVSIEGGDLEVASTSFTRCHSGHAYPGAAVSIGNEQWANGAVIGSTILAGKVTAHQMTITDSFGPLDAGIGTHKEVKISAALLTITPPCSLPTRPTIMIKELDDSVTTSTNPEIVTTFMKNIRGLSLLTPSCLAAAGTIPTLPLLVSLPACAGRSDLCGVVATCEDVPILVSASTPTTPSCSCTSPASPLPSASTPENSIPFVDGCATPHQISGVGIASLTVSSIVLELDKPATGSRTLTLRTGGTAKRNATWEIMASSVPDWLVLESMSGVFSGDVEAPIVTLTAHTVGIPERDEPYEALLQLNTTSDIDVAYLVPVLMLVNTENDAQTSTWGRVPAAENCSAVAMREGVKVEGGVIRPSLPTVVGFELSVPFTACDMDALPVAKLAPVATPFAVAALRPDGSAIAATMTYDAFGVYVIRLMVPVVGDYSLNVTLGGAPVSAGTMYFTATCPVGLAQLSDGSCACPAGNQLLIGGECELCSPGSFKTAAGNTIQCEPCPVGTSAPGLGSTECTPCPAGQFSVSTASAICSTCPDQTSSRNGSSTCTLCANTFYKKDADAPVEDCVACPEEATCPAGTTTATMITNYAYWRLTEEATQFYKCETTDDDESPCPGGSGAAVCLPGYEGLQCQVCTEDLHYFNGGECIECPPPGGPAITIVGLITAMVVVLYLLYIFLHRPPKLLKAASARFNLFLKAIHKLGPSKIKTAVTFYQIINSLDKSFDLSPIAPDFKSLVSYFAFLDMDWTELFYPTGCFGGGYFSRLIIVSFVPIGAMFFAPLVLLGIVLINLLITKGSVKSLDSEVNSVIQTANPRNSNATNQPDSTRRTSKAARLSKSISDMASSEKMVKAKGRLVTALPMVLLVVFVMLPAISRSIFSAWDCIPIDAGNGKNTYYLRVDKSVECDSPEHEKIVGLAVVLTLLWPVGMQVLFFTVLFVNRKTLRRGRENALSRATMFLTGGYKQHVYYWEVVELFRRIACSGFVVLIPYDYIFWRILLALIVAIPICILTAYVQPFRRGEDNLLSVINQALLIFAFIICALIRIVNADLLDDQIKEMVGFTGTIGLFFALCALILAFIVILFSMYCYKVYGEYLIVIKKVGDANANLQAGTMFSISAAFSLLGLVGGGIIFGLVGGLAGMCIFSLVGAAVGSVAWQIFQPKSKGDSSSSSTSASKFVAPSGTCQHISSSTS